jgi:hypothetical protein
MADFSIANIGYRKAPGTGPVSFSPAPTQPGMGMGGYVDNSGGAGGANGTGEVKQLPFQKTSTSTPNLGIINPAFQDWQKSIQGMAPPDYSSYFNQLSQFAYDDARRQSAQVSAQHGGAPTAQGGAVVGGNQAALEALMGEQLNRQNVNRMWTSEDQWRQSQANAMNQAYNNYFNALASKAYSTEDSGYHSAIDRAAAGGGGSAFNFGGGSGGGSGTGGGIGGGGGGIGPGGGGITGPSGPGTWCGGTGDYPIDNYTDWWAAPGYPGGPNEGAVEGEYTDWWNEPGYPGGPNEGDGLLRQGDQVWNYLPGDQGAWVDEGTYARRG